MSELPDGALEGIVIFVIDDDRVQSELMTEHLSMLSAKVAGFTGIDALGTTFRGAPDVILLDLMLRGADGFEVTRDLRERGYTGPIVALSASAHMRDLARESGIFTSCILKPWNLADLIVAVQAALS